MCMWFRCKIICLITPIAPFFLQGHTLYVYAVGQ
jgi:hypothetical protein